MIIVGQVTIADNHILYIRGIDDIHVQATINGIVTSFKLKKNYTFTNCGATLSLHDDSPKNVSL